MIKPLTGATQILGIIGQPIRHSLSPLMQNATIQASALDYMYVPFEVSVANLGLAIAGLKALGVVGFNVTIPHKTAVMEYLDDLDETALAAGAVNTVKNESGRLIGYNTDGNGLVRSLAEDLDFDPLHSSIAVIGAGGAARGAIAALSRSGAKRIVIVNRTLDKATALVSVMSGTFLDTEFLTVSSYDELQVHLPHVDLLINTTSLGMNNEKIPIPRLDAMSPGGRVYDMVYSPRVTPLLRNAYDAGLRGGNGLGMLAAQGELAFTIWTGEIPPFGVMKRTLEAYCAS